MIQVVKLDPIVKLSQKKFAQIQKKNWSNQKFTWVKKKSHINNRPNWKSCYIEKIYRVEKSGE